VIQKPFADVQTFLFVQFLGLLGFHRTQTLRKASLLWIISWAAP
jgi:hypothetical protein